MSEAPKPGVPNTMKFVDKILKLIEDVIDEFAELQTFLWKKLDDHYARMVDPVVKEFNEGLDDDILDKVKGMLFKFYRDRMVQNREGVGILSAQSIGETSTQLSLNSFHSMGLANSTLSVGMAWLNNASKNKFPTHILKTKFKSLGKLDEEVGSKLCDVKLRHLIKDVAVIDNDFPFTDWHKKWANRHTLSGKINTSVVVRFFIDHESIFFFKVTPTMIQRAFEISFQQDSIAAILSPIDIGVIDVLIQSPKNDAKLTTRDPASERQYSKVVILQYNSFVQDHLIQIQTTFTG